ncbi:putative membrane protein YhfC [Salirhabdus euzebyi]|uniref:Putative membrane protein YhfC n=1 Tax=Salirhabdus euzebyi TaxID=394506 RepID=A0A841Q738_9BACI|nr:YhfC family glutamic-type intramembrane protease [Salirhabdus euzebyi]MBB6454137.1 putative membrane protein YhfC [Salirhabdus euzebyi]
MVSQSVLNGVLFQFGISFLLPIVLIIYIKKKYTLSWRAIGIGFLTFFIFVQILERGLHTVMIDPQSPNQLKWSENPFYYVLYGILAAGIFEEFGRFLSFKLLLKKKRSIGDGLSYGIGHGSFETLSIGVLGSVSTFLMIGLINNGEAHQTLSNELSVAEIDAIKQQLVDSPAFLYVLSGFERMAAMAMHLFLSLVVLLGINKGDFLYVWYAVFIHAVFNVAPALYQVGTISNVWVAEAIVISFGICAVFGIVKIVKKYRAFY